MPTSGACACSRGGVSIADDLHGQADALNALTDDFPPLKRLRFADVNMAQLRFPVEESLSEHPEGIPLVKPDIVASYPGDEGNWGVKDPMAMVSLSFVVRAEYGPDPLLSPLPEGVRARMRLLRLAGRHLGANGTLCSFIVSIAGPLMQVFRFDHAACIVSPTFDYIADPDLLRRFLWAFVHPTNGTDYVGMDEYCTTVTIEDMKWARRVVDKTWFPEDLHYNRWVRLPSTDAGKPDLEFLTLRRRALYDSVWSRGTCVWEAIRRGDESGKRYILKETWRQVEDIDEKIFYERIMQYDTNLRNPLFGVAGFVRSVDYGALEGQGVPTLHRTSSASLRPIMQAKRGERTLVRLVVDTIGEELEDFECSKDFIAGIRDAVQGVQVDPHAATPS